MHWQSMESAPKDGTRVLLFIPDKKEIVIGFYVDSVEYYYGKERRRSQYWSVISKYMGLLGDPQPMYWCPLPEMPMMPESELCDRQSEGKQG